MREGKQTVLLSSRRQNRKEYAKRRRPRTMLYPVAVQQIAVLTKLQQGTFMASCYDSIAEHRSMFISRKQRGTIRNFWKGWDVGGGV